MSVIYHICSAAYWEACDPELDYFPAAFPDEGFIHCSTATQLETSANKYYGTETALICLHINPDALTAPLKYEYAASRGEDFPHIYGGINRNAIYKVVRHLRDSEGIWVNLLRLQDCD
jgi:uncharacterized protein (DUF952 family)